jgi:transcription initiation factor TFIIB
LTYRLESPELKKRAGTVNKCPRCGKGPIAVDLESGERYCTNCGYVLQERVEETGPEWRSFSDDQKGNRQRTGAPTSITAHDMGLATVIGSSNQDAGGRTISGQMKSTVDRMRLWDRRSQPNESLDRNLRQAFAELSNFAEKLSLSEEVIERAAYIYRKALARNLLRGRSIISIVAASLYAACRDSEVPRTIKDVAGASNLTKKEVARAYRLLLKEMEIRPPVPDAARSIARIASETGMSEKTKRRAFEILTKAKQKGISAGKDPMGLAAAALYIATTLEGENITQKQISQAAEVTEVTIRNRYKNLKQTLAI